MNKSFDIWYNPAFANHKDMISIHDAERAFQNGLK